MKTFGDLNVGDTVYAIYPIYYKNGTWRYEIGDFKITYKHEWIPYPNNGHCWLIIRLDNGFYFRPESYQSFHLGSDNEDGPGKTYNFNVEYFTDLKNIKLIEFYEFVIKDIENTLRKKYKINIIN